MLKETITYTDFNGTERTEDFYFNLSEVEIMEMFAKISDKDNSGTANQSRGIDDMIKDIISAQSNSELIETFKELINKSYGQKSADGRRFVKDEKLTMEFTQTNAYPKLFMKLSQDTDAAIRFVNGIVPQNVGGNAGSLELLK